MEQRNRRQLLIGGMAVLAAAAGAGVGWLRHRTEDTPPGAEQGFWQAAWESPTGQAVTLDGLRGQHVLLNFWATWCPPCVEELPLLDRFYQNHQAAGWRVMGLAVDQPSAVRAFLQRTPLSFPVAMAGLDGTRLSQAMGNPSGSLPFTVLLDPQGQIRQRKLGRLTEDDLAAWVSKS